ncbi:MAG TPA: hypothetical protein VJ724_07445 [Tahibacter sp.]|nr:hypothetical protein [Tahibacter sp.]
MKTEQPARFDPAERRPAIRRTVLIVVGVVAAIYVGFFLRAVVFS